MESFVALLCSMGTSRMFIQHDDLVSRLPCEISSTIFRFLDGRSLYIASLISTVWAGVIRGDPILRRRLRAFTKTIGSDPLNAHFKKPRKAKRKQSSNKCNFVNNVVSFDCTNGSTGRSVKRCRISDDDNNCNKRRRIN